MQKKRPVGVTIFGWLTFAIGVIGLIVLFVSLILVHIRLHQKTGLNYFVLNKLFFSSGAKNVALFFFGLGYRIIIGIFLIIVGRGILSLRNWARRLYLIFTSLPLLMILLTYSLILWGKLSEYNNVLDKLSLFSAFIYYIISVFYFTRSKVKEQFK